MVQAKVPKGAGRVARVAKVTYGEIAKAYILILRGAPPLAQTSIEKSLSLSPSLERQANPPSTRSPKHPITHLGRVLAIEIHKADGQQ